MLQIRNISKSFGGTNALDNINFTVSKAEIHALVGTNGSGKSTLIKSIMGVIKPDSGEIFYKGEKLNIHNPSEAQKIGIGAIYQEPTLIPYFTAAENICLGHEETSNKLGQINKSKRNEIVKEIIERFDLDFPINQPVSTLGVGQQRVVEIAKVLSLNCKLILVDEATAGMPEKEMEKFFEILKSLKNKGITIIYISHYLENIFNLADQVTILRDGQYISTEKISESSVKSIIPKMLGKTMGKSLFPEKPPINSSTRFSVRSLCYKNLLQDINFDIPSNSIVGVAGLLGAGKSELARSLYGLEPKNTKGVLTHGRKKIDLSKCKINFEHGVVYLPEERKEQSIFPLISIGSNICLGNMKLLCKKIFGIFKKKAIDNYCNKVVEDMHVKLRSLEQEINELSGGNQQKVLLGKWIGSDPSLLLLDEPTRGIDVGAKSEIYHKIREVANEGKSVIVFSSEIDELVGLCDKVLVLYKGKLIKELEKEDITKDQVLFYSMGGEHAKSRV